MKSSKFFGSLVAKTSACALALALSLSLVGSAQAGIGASNGLTSVNGMSSVNGLTTAPIAAPSATWLAAGIDPSKPLAQVSASNVK